MGRSLNSEARVYTVDILREGMAFGCHAAVKATDLQRVFGLHFERPHGTVRVPSRYSIEVDQPVSCLESRLRKLSRAGVLRRSRIFLGVTADPFLPFEQKFDRTLAFLKLFERFTPGILHIQTRSPLVVLAMPILRGLGRHVSVTLGIETHRDDLAKRFSPSLPLPSERLKTARTLRGFGIEVVLQVNPLLPYGDWRDDAPQLGSILANASDYLSIQPLVESVEEAERLLKRSRLVQRLSQERKYFWIRPDSHMHLVNAVSELAPEKLQEPSHPWLQEPQLSFFDDIREAG